MQKWFEFADNTADSYINLKNWDQKLPGRSVILYTKTIELKRFFWGD
jgi:hypothetical protein